jgi:hypothetical protein
MFPVQMKEMCTSAEDNDRCTGAGRVAGSDLAGG